MYSILLNSENEGHSFNSFSDKFIQICKEHKDQGRALAFAFIFYDFENAQISKVLQDTDYWLSLNAISGKYLTVFSLHRKPKVKYKRRRKVKTDNHVFYNMVSILGNFNNPSESSNTLIEKYFGKDIQIKYPAVMFFQVHNDKVIGYTLIELDEQEIEPAFIELKTYIAKAVEILKQITDENKQNSKEIFNLIESQVKRIRIRKVAKQTVKNITSLVELASSIVGLGG
ncbi:MAG: hypothetical protein HZB79_07190 [Deltaproteobacteria bacterium]|nr:hypothetical protein [Deltaproteobacteria bacterium]